MIMSNLLLRELKNLGLSSKYILKKAEGWYKLHPQLLEDYRDRSPFYIAVSGINPTPLGEGKTFITLALSGAFSLRKRRAISTIRQPSLGIALGRKGGRLGGGRIVVPQSQDILLRFNTDTLRVNLVQNIIASLADNLVYFNRMGAKESMFARTTPVCDRVLRTIDTRLGRRKFFITEAGEVMAILSLARDYKDLQRRLSKIVVCIGKDRSFIELGKLSKFLSRILYEAFMPNVFLTEKGGLFLVHTGPFANISTGNSSVIADRVSTRLCDYLITESGFGTECGLEKLMHLKCPSLGKRPNLAIVVCSLRALKYHSCRFGLPLEIKSSIHRKNKKALKEGLNNLKKHLENVKAFNLEYMVVINRFSQDSLEELNYVKAFLKDWGVRYVFIASCYQEGEESLFPLIEAVEDLRKKGQAQGQPLFSKDLDITQKVSLISKNLYGASSVSYSERVKEKIKLFRRWGFGNLGVCIAKTQFSLSADPKSLGRVEGFDIPITDAGLYRGAGFIYFKTKGINLLPGLPRKALIYDVERIV